MEEVKTTIVEEEVEKVEESVLFQDDLYKCLVYRQRLSEDLYMTICGVETGGHYDTEGREGYHLHVVFSGKGKIYVDGKEHSVRFGQLFLVKPNEKVWYKPDPADPWKYCWIGFDGTKAEKYINAAGFKKGVYVLDCHVEQHLFYNLVKKILDKPELTYSNDMMRMGILYEYLGLAMESNYYNGQVVHHQREYSPDAYVEHALEFVRNNYNSIRVGDIAKYIGINRSYLANIFKEKVGISPQEYLVQFRLGIGAKLLRSTNLPIQDISMRVGYSDPLTFSKMFKRVYGVSPRAYRTQEDEVS